LVGMGSIQPEPDQPISMLCSTAIIASSVRICGETRRRYRVRAHLPGSRYNLHGLVPSARA
jgi:hypothetical protein